MLGFSPFPHLPYPTCTLFHSCLSQQWKAIESLLNCLVDKSKQKMTNYCLLLMCIIDNCNSGVAGLRYSDMNFKTLHTVFNCLYDYTF